MEHAWLDSLSEDWVSQPHSGSPAPSLPSLSNSTSNPNSCIASSRIPKYNSQKQGWTAPNDSSNSPLSERSLNEHNIPLSQRASRRPSKLRQVTNGTRGRHLSRTVSASSAQSVQHHTVQHKSHSLSPKKGIQDTPEWRRRLLNGDVAYGEQRDLFSPAGLESIFQPPPAQTMTSNKSPMRIVEEISIMPSSPPPYNRSGEEGSSEEDQNEEVIQNRDQPRGMKYRLADEGSSFSAKDLSRSSSFQPPTRLPQDTTRGGDDSELVPGFSSSIGNGQTLNNPAGRTVSGQSDIRHEELSPIYVARHNTIDGKIDYAALDVPADELQRRLEGIQEESPIDSIENTADTSQISKDDITVGTDDFAHNGGFINIRRGGHSQEGSFQKRMLSPSSLPAIDESIMLPEESMQASTPKQLPNIKKTRTSNEQQSSNSNQSSFEDPQTPRQSPEKPSTKSSNVMSGSPLKLFGTYDTFTNQKLLRRLSQFEGTFDDPENEDESIGSAYEPARREVNDSSFVESNPENSRRVTSFGEGDLNDFQFSEDISYNTTRTNPYEEDKENISLPVLDPRTQKTFKFELDPSALESNVVVRRKTQYTTTTSTSRHVDIQRTARPGTSSSAFSQELASLQTQIGPHTPRKRYGDSEGKRLPKSPLKDPTPKRRRTLHQTEMLEVSEYRGDIEMESINETHHKMMSVIGRKRKDARHGDDQQAANPKVLAMRQILRPRTPTPSQRSSQMQEREPLQELDIASIDREKIAQDKKIAKIQAELDATEPLRISALGVSQQMQNDSRKGSVTTQDFLDEAKKIMAGIRGKARPHSGLTSLEESESENDRRQSDQESPPQEGGLEDSYQESTQEPFSRPPSRENGAPLPRLPKQQEDPVLLDHLRKYQEKSDMDGVIASSMKSIAMAKEAAVAARETDRLIDETISRSSARLFTQGQDGFASDPPNIRISENPDANRKRKHSTSSAPNEFETQHEDDFPSHGSNVSSNQSTSRSIPTGSSRGSDSRRVIAPHTVSHLIPEQLAGMVFDRERNIWVKRKHVSAEHQSQNFLPSDETEEDPFGDIPDLSVDESQEMQRIKAVAAKRKEEARVVQAHIIQEEQEHQRNGSFNNLNGTIAQTKKTVSTTVEDVSSPSPAKSTQISSDNTATGAQTVSIWENLPTNKSTTTRDLSEKYEFRRTETHEEVFEEVEREISIHEDRIHHTPPRRRNVTISFSSPLASIIEGSAYGDIASTEQGDADESELSDDGGYNGSILVRKAGGSQNLSATKQRKPFRGASRRVSLGSHKFSVRPVSRIDERDEDISNENEGHRSVSLVVSNAGIPTRQNSLVLATPRPAHEIGTLTLTPLSEFTVHQADESLGLDVSYVAQRQRHVLGENTKRSLSLSIKNLVEKITEVEPYEPFWEHIKQMELKDKRLTNLHKLDEFCEQLEELDVSHNQVCQLDGIPKTVRHLNIAHNRLSDLTAWGHLRNLQYVDVSNNEIESLSGFKFLIHMRSLRADNNKITTLEGIDQLDGLLSLRLRGNSVQELNFRGTKLHRLTDLDLQSNHISRIEALHDLESLTTLNLTDNHLSEFGVLKSEVLPAMKHLKLSGNNLESLDVSHYPNLRLLYLDRNRLGTVTGLLKAKYLDSLSMREQQQDSIINPEFLNEAFEVRKLFLSGNLLGTFEPRSDFLNLQYLELANCGIESLPEDFGIAMSNLRVLNLNFNALKDVTPLLGIVRLKKLYIAGNRIEGLKRITEVFAHFPYLALVDLRGNPLTVGFYPSIMETRMVMRDAFNGETDVQEPYTLAKANKSRDERYLNCLDMETRIKRRLYDLLLLRACPRMKQLDGMEIDMMEALKKKDKVFDEMVKLGYLVKTAHAQDEVEEDAAKEEEEPELEQEQELVEESRWEGEDSFA